MTAEQKARKRALDREWRLANIEHKHAMAKAWYSANVEKVKCRSAAWYVNNLEKGRATRTAYTRTPRGRFGLQRQAAKDRGIEWQFTFEEWAAWWGADYAKRGRGKDGLVMARYNDTGPYHPANVYKATGHQNCIDRERIRAAKRKAA